MEEKNLNKNPIEKVRKIEWELKQELENYQESLKKELIKFKEDKEEELKGVFFSLKPEIEKIKEDGKANMKKTAEDLEEKIKIDYKKIEDISAEEKRKQIEFIKGKVLDYI